MATHSLLLRGTSADRRTEPGGLQAMGWQRAGHDLATKPREQAVGKHSKKFLHE